jgi:hypothetical protein
MELYISIILNVIFLLIILNLQGKSKEVEEKIVYVPEIIYRDKIEYKDRVVYQDRVVKEYVSSPGNVVVNNNIGNTKKTVTKKPKAVKKVKEKVSEPLENVSPKRAEILKELATLKSKKNKTKQDIDNIYTLEMILPNIK